VCCRFENALKRHCPTCCIPYVDTRLDCSLPTPSESAIWSPWFLGNNFGPVRSGVAANWSPDPADCDVFGNGVLTRYVDGDSCWGGSLYTDSMIQTVKNSESYDDLCQPYDFCDFESDHGGPHMWLSGHMESLPCAPLDPYFWMHHCFIDMLGELLKDLLPPVMWRYPQNWRIPYAHRPNDRMRPFSYRNADGLYDDNIGKNYIYEISPADYRCRTERECSPLGLLWCDVPRGAATGRCKAKCREGGRCRIGFHAMCYCPRGTAQCNTGICQC